MEGLPLSVGIPLSRVAAQDIPTAAGDLAYQPILNNQSRNLTSSVNASIQILGRVLVERG